MKKTNIWVDENLWTYINKNKQLGETINDTLKRLLGIDAEEEDGK